MPSAGFGIHVIWFFPKYQLYTEKQAVIGGLLFYVYGSIDDRINMSNQQPWWADTTPQTQDSTLSPKINRHGVIWVVVSFVLIIASMITALVFGPNPDAVKEGQYQSTVYPADTESLIAGCGDTFAFSPPAKNYGALPDDFFVDPNSDSPRKRNVPKHPMVVPAYGYFINNDNIKFEQKFYTEQDLPVIESREDRMPGIQRPEYLKLMWDGWKIIWYKPSADEATKQSISEFVNSQENVVALPWTNSETEVDLPAGRSFAFSAWNTTRSCGLWDSDVAGKFVIFADDYNKTRDRMDIPNVRLDATGEAELIRVP